MGRKRSIYYVSPDELKLEVQRYKDSSKNPDKRVASERLGEMILKIATRYANRPNLIAYSYKDDFISYSTIRILNNLNKIDLDHPNCNIFAYFSRVCERATKHILNKEKIQVNIKTNVMDLYADELKDEGYDMDLDKSGYDYSEYM